MSYNDKNKKEKKKRFLDNSIISIRNENLYINEKNINGSPWFKVLDNFRCFKTVRGFVVTFCFLLEETGGIAIIISIVNLFFLHSWSSLYLKLWLRVICILYQNKIYYIEYIQINIYLSWFDHIYLSIYLSSLLIILAYSYILTLVFPDFFQFRIKISFSQCTQPHSNRPEFSSIYVSIYLSIYLSISTCSYLSIHIYQPLTLTRAAYDKVNF